MVSNVFSTISTGTVWYRFRSKDINWAILIHKIRYSLRQTGFIWLRQLKIPCFLFVFFLKERNVPMISIFKFSKLFSFSYCSLRHVQFLFNAIPIVCAYIFSFSQATGNIYEVISTVIICKTHTHFLFFKNKIQAYIENAKSYCSNFWHSWSSIWILKENFPIHFFLYHKNRKHLSIMSSSLTQNKQTEYLLYKHKGLFKSYFVVNDKPRSVP